MEKKDSRIPVAVGVTGHIDILKQDEADLRKAVRDIYDMLNRDYPNSPKVLLSSLAEGADRLAADEAVNCGFSLIAPLPMSVDEYEKDFVTDESKNEFRRLLSRSETYFTVPGGTNKRPGCYRLASFYTAKNSNILIALWDGSSTVKTGGTYDTIKLKLEVIPNVEATQSGLLDMPDNGAVYHILTPREQNPKPQGILFSLNKLYPVKQPGVKDPPAANRSIPLAENLKNSHV